MSFQTRDLRCVDCGWVAWNVSCEYQRYPTCSQCGGETHVTWEGRQPPATDVFGCPQYSDASGEWHTSQHEKDHVMREAGYYPSGDPVGGARKEHRLKNSAWSWPGQKSRISSAERAAARAR